MSKTVKDEVSDISPVLFLDPSGRPMRFYLRPGDAKQIIYPSVVKGGGYVCRTQEPDAILLVDPKDVKSITSNTGQTYYSMLYITDCVEQNQLLDINSYTVSFGPSVQTRTASRNGRMGYSQEDDAAILKFIEKRRSEAKGKRIWLEMQNHRVTAHSWQSMKDRFLKHLQNKPVDKTPEKSSKRKALLFRDSSLSKENGPQTSPKKSPLKFAVVPDATDTQIADEERLNLSIPELDRRTLNPQRTCSVAKAVEEPSQGFSDDVQQEFSKQIQEQETMDEEEGMDVQVDEQAQPQQSSESPETSKRRILDVESDEQDVVDESNGQSLTFIDARSTTSITSTPNSEKLGILARAAKEFEDSDVIDDESIEDEGPREAPLMNPSIIDESSAASAVTAGESENQAEDQNKTKQSASKHLTNGLRQTPEDENPAANVTSKAHEFIFESESQEEAYSQMNPAETSSLLNIKQHIVNLMRETQKDLIKVTKALLMSSGDLSKARVYLVDGYDYETHGPLWTFHDDNIVLQNDPLELEQLQLKYGEDNVSKRRAFLTADVH